MSKIHRLVRLADKANRYLRRHLPDGAQVSIILVDGTDVLHAFSDEMCPVCEASKLHVLARQIERRVAESN